MPLPVRISDDLFFAVICVDDADNARYALGDQAIDEATPSGKPSRPGPRTQQPR
jgi:hypothetical protein